MSVLNWATRIALLKALPLIGKNREAVVLYDRFEKRPPLRGLRQAIALARENGGQENHIANFGRKAIARFPGQVIGYLALAEQDMRNGNYAGARRILEAAPQTRDVRKFLGGIPTEKKLVEFSSDGRALALEDMIRESKTYIFRNPYEWWGYEALANALIRMGKHGDAEKIIRRAPQKVREQLGFHLQLADLAASKRDQLGEAKTLLAAQALFPAERRILHRLAGLYRDDGQVERAQALFHAAQLTSPILGTVRRLSFEAEHGYIDNARAILDVVASFSPDDKLRFLPNWNRVAPRFPERAAEFARWRENAREAFNRQTPKTTNELDTAIGRGIKARWISDCFRLVERSANLGVEPSADVLLWLNAVKTRLGVIADLIDYGFANEAGDEMIGLHDGMPVSVRPDEGDSETVVEFFIPSAFFARPEEEKSSYETVRQFMHAAAQTLLGNPDIKLVVRHQFNWRYAVTRTRGRAVSYHTFDHAATNRLHVQESPLAGRCSVDRMGFAGYAEIAEDFSRIDAETMAVSRDVLEQNQKDLFAHYVEGNVSKYTQAETRPLSVDGPYVFVAMQIPTDIVADIAYVPGVEMLRVVADHYAGSGCKVVVKRHPYCTSMSLQREIEALEASGKIVTTDASIHDLISKADIVFCVNSGVGLEALLHMKPVIVTGKCDYAYAVAYQAKSAQELKTALSAPVTLNEERVLKLLYFYKNVYTRDPSPETVAKVLADWLPPSSTGSREAAI